MPAHKYGKNEISDRSFEALEAFELMLAEKPGGVTAYEVHQEFGRNVSHSAYRQRAEKLVRAGLLKIIMKPPTLHNYYVLAPNFAEKKAGLTVLTAAGLRPVKERGPIYPVPKLAPAPKLQEPELLNGLPYTPSAELRNHLGKVIEGLEMVKSHIGPTLALLLDLDRDFGRYTNVREKLDDLKTQLAGVRI